MAFKKTNKNISKYKGKGNWQGGNKQNFTYPKNKQPDYSNYGSYDKKLDGTWMMDPQTYQTTWYSRKDYDKLEKVRMEEWEKKHKKNELGIWIAR